MNTSPEMKIISAEFALVSAHANQLEAVDFFSDRHKTLREWQILGAACDLMSKGGATPPFYAEKAERPDFRLYSIDAVEMGGIEVTEAMPHGYLRHKEFKDEERNGNLELDYVDPPLSDPWRTLRSILLKKAAKNYLPRTSLLVYYNIGIFSFKNWNVPVLLQLFDEHLRLPFEGLSQFEEAMILDAGMTSLARIHPNVEMLYQKP